jgi:hypothetical protein
LFEPWRTQPSTALVVRTGHSRQRSHLGRLKHPKAVDDLAQGDGVFDTARSRRDRGSGDVGLGNRGMFGSVINAPPFDAEQRDRIAVTALPQGQRMKP